MGRELELFLRDEGKGVIGIDRDELDFSEPHTVAAAIAGYGASWVINCAAYTAVDDAESNRELTFRINRDSAGAVAEGAKRCGARMLHISTDFIFDGKKSQPYTEEDRANPLSVYGQSKWEGEQVILNVLPDATIVRSSWIFGAHGNNFVKTILRLASERDELQVIDDQIGTPSWTADIAGTILTLIDADASGIYNFTNEGVATWYDFAETIVNTARDLGYPLKAKIVRPIPTTSFPTPATRPHYSVLSKRKIRNLLATDIPHWRQSVETMLNQLQSSAG